MQITDSIAFKIFKSFTFSQAEIAIIESKFHKEYYNKGDVILNVGEVVYDQYFVDIGCLRAFFLKSDGKEHTVQFAINDWWMSDYTAFFYTENSTITIECLQDSSVYRISRTDLKALYKEVPLVETFFREKLEKAYANFQRRILSANTQNTQERYLDFVQRYPGIVENVKNYHIASYLGVTTETLSRIRKEITQG
ncbi:Crp/Fnr family transcriptional regulator [Wenyingzhuangia sp. IMCC45574]